MWRGNCLRTTPLTQSGNSVHRSHPIQQQRSSSISNWSQVSKVRQPTFLSHPSPKYILSPVRSNSQFVPTRLSPKDFSLGRRKHQRQPHHENEEPVPIGEVDDHGSTRAVVTSIVTNTIVSIGKFAGFVISGSGSLLSEAIHSLADTANQSLLYIGIRRSRKSPTDEHPYGFTSEQYVWSLISAVGIFFIGSGTTIYHGIHSLFHPEVSLVSLPIAFAVLISSLLLEGYTFGLAIRACYNGAKANGMTFKEFILRGPDPMGVAVLLEDSVAVIGVGIAASCVALTYFTGDPIYDSIGTILVGILLGMVAVMLVQKNKAALLGRAAPEEQQQKLMDVLVKNPVIQSVYEFKAITMGASTIRLNAEVEFRGDEISRKYLNANPEILNQIKASTSQQDLENILSNFGAGVIKQLGSEVDQIERDCVQEVPQATFVDIETH
eukprot:TRINITY_DN15266_c0_g1_i1.p1 TRINITY_DN15266_c0_g1~~TRINITY_DN15266_c0_g1_i1.p1  ORF type:complete len:437 (+),score=98.12 TRINITY_DN15266_c0_g1_i1:37-1347(+)